MQRYRCHKIVEAQDLNAKHVSISQEDGGGVQVFIDGEKNPFLIPANRVNSHTLGEIEDGYLVQYADGYISWNPRKAFEDGYAAIPPDAR